jgi:hypothetical protein
VNGNEAAAAAETPHYIPREHAETYARYRRLADLFDQAYRIPGTPIRFGLDALLGLLPGGGDLLGSLFAGYGILLARRMGAPAALQIRMLGNVGLDLLGGAVPLVGDLFDVAFKAHVRNRRLMDRWLGEPRKVERASFRGLVAVPLAALLVLALAVTVTVAGFRWLGSLFATTPPAGSS